MADIIADILGVTLVCMTWSYIYKDNPAYTMVEASSLGVIGAHYFVIALDILQKTVWGNLMAGVWWYIIAVAFGISFFFILAPPGPLRTIFRAATTLMIITELGRGLPSAVGYIFQAYQGATQVFSIGKAAWVVCLIFGLTFYIWNRKTEKVLTIPREIGKYVWYVYAAYNTAGSYLTRAGALIILSNRAIQWPMTLITLAALGIIAIEAVFGWNELLGRRPEIAAE
jgi:hypothetical protein